MGRRTSTTWAPGQGGKPRGAKDRYPRSAKRAVEMLLEEFGRDEVLLRDAIRRGLTARAPSNFPFVRMLIEHHAGAPDEHVAVVTKVIHEYHDA